MLFSMAGWLYGKITDIRNTLYDNGVFRSYSLGARTISIGNITTGGTGKTPLVAYVAEVLADAGEKVCILTRGYGRQNPRDRVLVSDGMNVLVDAATGGDEPVELARKLIGKAIVVADADRVAAAKWAKKKFGITAFVLDDGFQHRRAKRDLDIVCIDATNPFGSGSQLPAGMLREPVKNLIRADAIIITRCDVLEIQIERFLAAMTRLIEFVPTTPDELDQWYEQAEMVRTDLLGAAALRHVPHFFWHYLSDADIRMKDSAYAEMQGQQISSLRDELSESINEFKKSIRAKSSNAQIFESGSRIVRLRSLGEFESNRDESSRNDDRLSVLAFCALGNPQAFFAQLSHASNLDFVLTLTHGFPDHHRYAQSDISKLEEMARSAPINALFTTAKDAVKLSGLNFEVPCFVVETDVVLNDPDGFRNLVLSV